MSDEKLVHPIIARAQMTRYLEREGYPVPTKHRGSPPMIEWRAGDCRCWLLRVYLTPEGWVMHGRTFTVGLDEWIERINPDGTRTIPTDNGPLPLTVDTYRANLWSAFNAGEVPGVQGMLDLDPDTWKPAKFEVGCNHGQVFAPLSDLADDVRAVRRDQRKMARRVTVR